MFLISMIRNGKFKEVIISYFYKLNTGIRDIKQINIPINYQVPVKNKPVIINVILFFITFITTSFAGANSGDSLTEYLLSGLPYSITLLLILLSHEMGHYFAARHFGVQSTLPYFIPFPSIIGTMGAVIKIKSPVPNSRVLLYIGAIGPLAGFIISLVATIIGIYLSQIKPLPASGGESVIPIFGDSILYAVLIQFIHGTIPPGQDIYLSSYAWAGWIGFLVTSLNLMPVGQLDGSHILYALIGEKQKYFGWAVLACLIFLSFFWIGWIIWIVLILVFLFIAHPPINENSQLTYIERGLGWLCIVIFFLTFIPIPVKFM